MVFAATALFTSGLAIVTDTLFYKASWTVKELFSNPVITPWNSLIYNSSTNNLSEHGLHPFYQHLLVSIPLLLGPAIFSVPSVSPKLRSLPIVSSLTSLIILSIFPHQEPRFLLPLVPLMLISIEVPRSKSPRRYLLSLWIFFNAIFGVVMGLFHQGGVVPAQIWLGQQQRLQSRNMVQHGPLSEVFWFRTYSPPLHLQGSPGIKTTDLMGIPLTEMHQRVQIALGPECPIGKTVGLVAPWSSTDLDIWRANARENGLHFEEIWRSSQHLNFDDLDLAGQGVLGTIGRVVGRRGLVVWGINRTCEKSAPVLGGDW